MNRTTTLLVGSLFLLSAASVGQQSSPQTPEDAYTSRELIAWSQLQTPQPAPQPLPPKDKQIPQPEQPRDQQPTPPADANNQQRPIEPSSVPDPQRIESKVLNSAITADSR